MRLYIDITIFWKSQERKEKKIPFASGLKKKRTITATATQKRRSFRSQPVEKFGYNQKSLLSEGKVQSTEKMEGASVETIQKVEGVYEKEHLNYPFGLQMAYQSEFPSSLMATEQPELHGNSILSFFLLYVVLDSPFPRLLLRALFFFFFFFRSSMHSRVCTFSPSLSPHPPPSHVHITYILIQQNVSPLFHSTLLLLKFQTVILKMIRSNFLLPF